MIKFLLIPLISLNLIGCSSKESKIAEPTTPVTEEVPLTLVGTWELIYSAGTQDENKKQLIFTEDDVTYNNFRLKPNGESYSQETIIDNYVSDETNIDVSSRTSLLHAASSEQQADSYNQSGLFGYSDWVAFELKDILTDYNNGSYGGNSPLSKSTDNEESKQYMTYEITPDNKLIFKNYVENKRNPDFSFTSSSPAYSKVE